MKFTILLFLYALCIDYVVLAQRKKKKPKKTEKTDHYLAATVDTVTWGYYDPNATPKVTMNSGETITVEVISHHSSHDYAKMIRGDPAVEEVFAWEIGQSLLEKNEPKVGTIYSHS